MNALKFCIICIAFCFGFTAIAQPEYYPPPANVIYHNDTLTICPPDSLPGNPVVLLAYNILVDSVFFDNLAVTNPTDTLDYIFTFPALPPGAHSFCVNAVYNQWISDQACDSATVIYGYELPFLEDWSSGSFGTLQWTSSSANWVISDEEGNPAPSARFRGDPALTNYAESLESYPISSLGMAVGKIWLDFHLELNGLNSTGNEVLNVQVWNADNSVWTTVAHFFNDEGSYNWTLEHINIKSLALNKIFKIRFQACGINSADIQNWSIDNIHIYRLCDGASDLVLTEHPEYNELFWWAIGPCPPPYLGWTNGVYSNNSIGTGGAVEFDVAARWDSEMLVDFQGAWISKIYFVPSEPLATYQIRIWTGEDPDSLLVDQLVVNPANDQWNGITLEQAVQIDASRDLWIGYHVNTPTGYPAGVDNGPAIDGYGNMMYFEGAWQTLLEINPDLDYNWSIEAVIGNEPVYPEVYFNIYRQTNNEDFQLYGTSETIDFEDNNIDLADHYCYKVSMVSIQYGDTCESAPTNTVCESINIGIDQHNQDQLIKIYPNPVKNWLNIESEEDIREIRIYTIIGEEVLKLEIGNLEAQVDVSRLESGIYYVKVSTFCREFKEKIVILR